MAATSRKWISATPIPAAMRTERRGANDSSKVESSTFEITRALICSLAVGCSLSAQMRAGPDGGSYR
eukprot:1226148-Amphidinium_carterae.2